MRSILPALLFLACPIGATAQTNPDTMQNANNLGTLLAAQSPCGLTYDQTAVNAWIDANVPADDMEFASKLELVTSVRGRKFNDMTETARAAQCHAATRTARHFGFID